MMQRLLKCKWLGFLSMFLSWLVLIWVRTFTGIVNGCDNVSTFQVLVKTVLTLLAASICGSILYILGSEAGFFYQKNDSDDQELEDEETSGLGKSVIVVLGLTVLFLLLFVSSELNVYIDLFRYSTDLVPDWWIMSKKVFYSLLILIFYPAWTTYIIRKISECRCSFGAVISGSIQILALTVMEFLLYMTYPGIWLIEMAVINICALIMAVRGYLWDTTQKKGNAVALVMGYVIFWGILISIFTYDGETFFKLMGQEAAFDPSIPGSYISNVNKILQNASLAGQSQILLKDPYILSFMNNRDNPLLAALFYGGWYLTMVLVLVEILFVMSVIAESIRNQREDGWNTVLGMSCIALLIRIVIGIPYSFGILPVPVLPLFSSEAGIMEDSICMGLVLASFLGNKFHDFFAEPSELETEILWDEENKDEDNE